MSIPAYDPNSFLTGGGIPSAFGKDDPVGTQISGVICEPRPEVKQQTDLQTNLPETWDNGDPKLQLVVTIQATGIPVTEEDDGKRRFYVKGGKTAGCKSMHDAVATAVRNSGAKGLEVGGTLAIQYAGSEPSKTRGFSDRKLWAASYTPPDQTAATGNFLGTNQAPQAPNGWQTPPTTPPPAWTPPPTAPPVQAAPAPAAAAPPSAEQLAAYQAYVASQQQNA